MTSTAMQHLEVLTQEIGPRGSTTDPEREASEYVRNHFEALGLETQWESFSSPRTGWRQIFYASLLSTLSVGIGIFGGRSGAWIAALISILTTASVLLEIYFRPNLLRMLVPKGPSQNVWARIPAKGEMKQRLMVLGHIDTHRTPWVFETPQRLNFFRVISTLGTISSASIGLLFLVLAIFDLASLAWLSLIFLPILLIVLIMAGQADQTAFTQGANDNGSGSSIVLSLADQIKAAPIEKTEVWLLVTGCEEVGSYGAQAFVDTHGSELDGLLSINLDNVGGHGAGVCYISVEGMLLSFKPSPILFNLAETLRVERGDENIYPKEFTTLHTDATCLMSHGIPSMSFVGLTPDGTLPNWHRATDTLERIDPQTIEAVDKFVLEMIYRLDSQV